MALKFTGWGKFAELVANHVFTDENRDVDLAVVNGDSAADHLWRDCRMARPGLDDSAILGRESFDFLLEFVIDERAFLKTS